MDKTEQKTEDKQVVAESLEDLTMSVLKEEFDETSHKLFDGRYELDPDRRRALFKEWMEATSAYINSEGRNEEAEAIMKKNQEMLGLSKAFIDAYSHAEFLANQSFEPPEMYPGP